MKVYIRETETLYDSEEDPIVIQLTPLDRLHIITMPPDAEIYASVPERYTQQQIKDLQFELSKAFKVQKDPVGSSQEESSSESPQQG